MVLDIIEKIQYRYSWRVILFMDDRNQVVEHIKIIQQIINRMSSAMLSVKTLSLVVFSLLVGLAAKDKISIIFIVLYPLLLLFMFFDMFYLWQERLFRNLYDEIRSSEKTNFSMDTKIFIKTTKYFYCIKSIVIWPFYLSLIIINTIILFLIIK